MVSKSSTAKDATALVEVVEKRLQRVHTQSLDLSFNELLDMKVAGELNISPDFQRLFQWSEGARSRFIESLILEMPVPPIYVVEEEDGRYQLIDGLQRISSYLHLRGKLEAAHLDPPVKIGESLRLCDCDIVEELNGLEYDDLATSLKIRLKRAFVRVEVVRKGSDPRFKYHMFKRLNTGGQLLTAQQLRNCTIRLLEPTFADYIIETSKNSSFKTCTSSLSKSQKLGAFDQELVLRFFALKNYRDHYTHGVSDFLTEYMESVSELDEERKILFSYQNETGIFEQTFSLLSKALGEEAFSYANPSRTGLSRGFSVYHFEAFTVGIQETLRNIDLDDQGVVGKFKRELMEIKLDENFISITTGGGKNDRGPLQDRIGFVTERLDKRF